MRGQNVSSHLQAAYFVFDTLNNLILVNQESSVPSSNDDIFSSPSSRCDVLGATSGRYYFIDFLDELIIYLA